MKILNKDLKEIKNSIYKNKKKNFKVNKKVK